VLFKPAADQPDSTASPAASAAALNTHVRAQLAAAGHVQAASAQPLEVLHTLGEHPAAQHLNTNVVISSGNSMLPMPDAPPKPSLAAAAAAAPTAAAASGVQGVVLRISSPVAVAAVRAASSVKAVVPDRIVAAQQDLTKPACADPQQLSQGLVPVLIAKTFVWHGCNNAANGGLRCASACVRHVQWGACTTSVATTVCPAEFSSDVVMLDKH
jgi:hypothetical protein